MNKLAQGIAELLEAGGIRVGSDGEILIRKSSKFQFLSTDDLADGVVDPLIPLCYLPVAFTAHDGSIGVYVQFDGSLTAMYFSGSSGWGYALPVTRDMGTFAKSPIKTALAIRKKFVLQDAVTWERYLQFNFPELLPDINGNDPIQEFAKPGVFARFSKWNYDDWLARHKSVVQRHRSHQFFSALPTDFGYNNPDLWLELAGRIASEFTSSRALPCIENAFMIHLSQQESIHGRPIAYEIHKTWIQRNQGIITGPLYDILLQRYFRGLEKLHQKSLAARILPDPPPQPKTYAVSLDEPVDIVYFRDGSMLKVGQRITCFSTRDDGERYQYETKIDQILTAAPVRDTDGSAMVRVKALFKRNGRDETAIITKVSDLTDPPA
jgi:hypothetical protein